MSHTQPAPAHRFVTYLRVSTAKQGDSGLGLEAQRAAVDAYIRRMGQGAVVLEEYCEVESGRRNDRPKLEEAIEHARLSGARLVIAKLDRLSRNVHFLSGLKDSGVDFVAADMPDANALTVHILAAVAEHERELIGQRTKAALAAAKARGTRLGNPNGAAHLNGRGNREAVATITANADAKAERLRKTIAKLEADGITSARAIAGSLNAKGILSPRGKGWSATSVQRLRMRLGEAV